MTARPPAPAAGKSRSTSKRSAATSAGGASKISQLQSNLAAANVIARLSPEILGRIDEITKPLAM